MSGEASSRAAWSGYAEAVSAAALWGSSGIFSVYLFRMDVPPETIALVRPVLGLGFMGAYLVLFRRSALRVPWKGLAVLGLGGGLAVGIFQIAYQASIDAVGVPSTVALLYLAPAFVVGASGPLLGEWPSRRRVGLAALAVAGVWLSVLGAQDVEPKFGSAGLGWGLAAGLSYAAYTLLGRFATPRWGSIPTVVYSTAGACVLLLATVPVLGDGWTPPSGMPAWTTLAVFGLLTVAVAQFLFFDALGRIEASRASVAATAEPVVASLLATGLLSQGLRPIGWVGLSLVVAGVAGVGFTRRKRAA